MLLQDAVGNQEVFFMSFKVSEPKKILNMKNKFKKLEKEFKGKGLEN